MLVGRAGGHVDSTPAVDLEGDTLSDFSLSPTNSVVGYQLTPTGLEQSFEGNGSPYGTINTWLNSGVGADYDCRLTVDSGTTPAGASTGTWLQLNTARAWTLTDSSPIGGAITNSCTIEIRDGTTLSVLATATVTMSVLESF